MNDNIIIQRLKEFMDSQGINRNQLAKHTGCSATAVGDYLDAGKTIGKIIAKAIEVYPQLSTEWLFRGTGEMILSDNSFADEPEPQYASVDAIKLTIENDMLRKRIAELEDRNIQLQKEVAVLEYLQKR